MLIKGEGRGKVSTLTFSDMLPIGSVFLLILCLLLVGAFAVYLEPWHADVFEFLDLRKNHGKVGLGSLHCIQAYAIFFCLASHMCRY